MISAAIVRPSLLSVPFSPITLVVHHLEWAILLPFMGRSRQSSWQAVSLVDHLMSLPIFLVVILYFK
uniref:Uncharacterized protein n=1 Tax=Fagus sylvatica TaxID=28930 RepID=A0A2N9H3V2_FAGSY